MRGRRPSGPEFVLKLDASTQSKERLHVILQTMMGTLRVQEACARLGISEVRLQQLRATGFQGFLDAIEPRAAGRPSLRSTPEAEQIRALEAAVAEKDLQLHQAQVREEVALILPRAGGAAAVSGAADVGLEKKTPRRPRQPR